MSVAGTSYFYMVFSPGCKITTRHIYKPKEAAVPDQIYFFDYDNGTPIIKSKPDF